MRRFIALALVAAAATLPAAANDNDQVEVEGVCVAGQLAALRLYAPRPGVYTIKIPRDVCPPPAPSAKPGRWST